MYLKPVLQYSPLNPLTNRTTYLIEHSPMPTLNRSITHTFIILIRALSSTLNRALKRPTPYQSPHPAAKPLQVTHPPPLLSEHSPHFYRSLTHNHYYQSTLLNSTDHPPTTIIIRALASILQITHPPELLSEHSPTTIIIRAIIHHNNCQITHQPQ